MKVKRLLEISVILTALLVLAAGCGMKKQAPAWQTIEHGGLGISLQVPGEFVVQQPAEGEFVFLDREKNEVGGIHMHSYDKYRDRILPSSLPNHSQVKCSEEVDVRAGGAWLFTLERSHPAASGLEEKWLELHAVIPRGKLSGDIWLKVPPGADLGEKYGLMKEILNKVEEVSYIRIEPETVPRPVFINPREVKEIVFSTEFTFDEEKTATVTGDQDPVLIRSIAEAVNNAEYRTLHVAHTPYLSMKIFLSDGSNVSIRDQSGEKATLSYNGRSYEMVSKELKEAISTVRNELVQSVH